MTAAGVYIRAATPWAILGSTVALLVGLLVIVACWPYSMWPLHGGAVGLIAGASAWAVDEECASVVDVTPRPLWWRSACRVVTPVVLSATWVGCHLAARRRLPDHLNLFLLEGVTAAALGFAGGTLLRSWGRAEPGQWIASLACPLTLAVALARPATGLAPVFPIWPSENWARSAAIWSSAAAVSVVLVVVALSNDARCR